MFPRILVVGDEPSVTDLLAYKLCKAKYDVLIAEDGRKVMCQRPAIADGNQVRRQKPSVESGCLVSYRNRVSLLQ
jgi:DNA-binding response OmpR family regulator